MREKFNRLPRPHLPTRGREVIMAAIILLGTGVLAEYQFQVVRKLGDSAGATAQLIDNSTYPLRKSISNGAHAVGVWADPGPAR